MGGNITPKFGNIRCPQASLSATLCHSVILSKILTMRSHFQAKIKRQNGFVLEKPIHRYFFPIAIKSI